MKFWNGMTACGAVLALSATGFAQSGGGATSPPPTCATAPTAVNSLQLERTLTLDNFFTTLTPNAPPSLISAIDSGAAEVRERLFFTPSTTPSAGVGTLTSTIFWVDAGSPTPIPLQSQIVQMIIQTSTIQVSAFQASCTPTPAIAMVGRVVGAQAGAALGQGTNPPPLFDVNGAPAVFSFGYTTDDPPKFDNVVLLIGGLVVTYAPSATGIISLTTPPPDNGGGGGTTAPAAIITFDNGTVGIPTTIYQVSQSPLFLSGAASTGTGLRYGWTFSSNAPVVFIPAGAPSDVNVQFPAPGDYVLTLTVTDSSGAANSTAITVQYTGRPQ